MKIKQLLLATAMMVLLYGAPVQAQSLSEPWKLVNHITLGIMPASAFSDAAASTYCIGSNPNCKEANPLLSWASGQPGVLAGLKGGIAVLQTEYLVKLHEKHPRWALALATGASAYNFYLAHRAVVNSRVK